MVDWDKTIVRVENIREIEELKKYDKNKSVFFDILERNFKKENHTDIYAWFDEKGNFSFTSNDVDEQVTYDGYVIKSVEEFIKF